MGKRMVQIGCAVLALTATAHLTGFLPVSQQLLESGLDPRSARPFQGLWLVFSFDLYVVAGITLYLLREDTAQRHTLINLLALIPAFGCLTLIVAVGPFFFGTLMLVVGTALVVAGNRQLGPLGP